MSRKFLSGAHPAREQGLAPSAVTAPGDALSAGLLLLLHASLKVQHTAQAMPVARLHPPYPQNQRPTCMRSKIQNMMASRPEASLTAVFTTMVGPAMKRAEVATPSGEPSMVDTRTLPATKAGPGQGVHVCTLEVAQQGGPSEALFHAKEGLS